MATAMCWRLDPEEVSESFVHALLVRAVVTLSSLIRGNSHPRFPSLRSPL